MSWYWWIILIAQFNWTLPLLSWIYPLFMTLVFRDFTFDGFSGPFARFKLAEKDVEPWHAKRWRDWWGMALFGFICYREIPGTTEKQVKQLFVHESVHCWQAIIGGLLYLLSYFAHMTFIYFFQIDKHPYLDCWAERMARRIAGQKVEFTPNDWPQGPNDRWPWWN
jgi:hypothetical protein